MSKCCFQYVQYTSPGVLHVGGDVGLEQRCDKIAG